jgi:voltage-gated potassium channel Kch
MFNTVSTVLDPFRSVPRRSTSPGLFVQGPDWFLAWSLLAGAGLWYSFGRHLRRFALALVALVVLLLLVILIRPLWDAMPAVLKDMQFPYRLDTYIALSVAGLVLVGVLALGRLETGRRRTLLVSGLSLAVVVSAALCVWQLVVPKTGAPGAYANRDAIFVSVHKTPRTWYDLNNYADRSQPVVATSPGQLIIDPAEINSDNVRLTIDPPAGRTPFVANFVAGPYAVHVGGGIERAGMAKSGPAALRRVDGGSGPVTMTLSPAGGAVTIGRVLSLCAIASLLVLLVFAAGRRLRRR